MTKPYLLIILSCFCSVSYAQETVFPGDANANRIVDQYDLLSIGYAFGTTGPARIQTGDVALQGIPLFWNEAFPEGVNFIHADCDGNGTVDYLDFIALSNNFGYELENPSPLEVEEGILGVDPAFIWNNDVLEIAVSSGAVLDIPISIFLNNTQKVNGLAFNLRYSPQYFQQTDFSTENQWLRANNEAMSIVKNNTDTGLIRIATTRFGSDPLTGGGEGGILKLIVIGDMLQLLQAPHDTVKTKIYVEDILMVDENFNPIPVASDTFTLKLYHNIASTVNAPNSNELQASVFPNPSNGLLQLKSSHSFNTIELIDAMGRNTILYKGIPRKQWETKNTQLMSGIYTIRLRGTNGSSVLKYLVANNKL